ncbi:transmembrane protein 232 isoform X2 [Salmo salar]|uniref:Transmembrane protein 232 isoform X2 n=1 Tax=Salmo salar TaxID=8030 RepID=A0A1S3KTZ0_SALSA|nr:transmembrane protein 232 isoform X2 [Salmo salar]|eukprot:XP_013982171.1 PREDICTED: transmembrane protein 232 isoform X2 [Salmo salar]
MPIIKVPVVHNLGIISQTHKEDLQKRLFKKAQEITITTNSKATRNPFEITEEFIKKYNNSQGSEEQDKYNELARQLLSRSKRRAGLKCMGEGYHVQLPLAWTELLLLGLCHGKIQNDSLDSLLMSLDHAPVHAEQIPALFYLGESVLYWVCADTSQKPNLYTCEVKILKLGYLVFLRLFLFHISGNLSGYQRSKSHLHVFLKALSQCEPCYQPYPNILLSVHFMLRSGEIICGLEPFQDDSASAQADCQEYDVNQVLWHCLLSWYCVQNNVRQLSQVAHHLIMLREELQKDDWVDCALGLMVLGEAAKSSLLCLQMLMSLHINPKTEQDGIIEENEGMSQSGCWPWQLEHIYTTVLADICQHSSNAEIQKTALLGSQTPPGYHNTDGLLKLLNHSGAEAWQLRYSAVQALVCVCRGLSGAVLQEGLRNVAWITLQEHLCQETDQRVGDAARVIEAEINVPESSLLSERGKPSSSSSASSVPASLPGQLITWRLACTLSQLYLPPTPLQLTPHTKAKKEPPPPSNRPRLEACRPLPKETLPGPASKTQHPTRHPEEYHSAPGKSKKYQTYMDFNARTDVDLMRVVEDQWQKELQIKMAEEEDAEKNELEKVQKEKEEQFKEIMRRRVEKVKKDTKPYELPGYQQTGGQM